MLIGPETPSFHFNTTNRRTLERISAHREYVDLDARPLELTRHNIINFDQPRPFPYYVVHIEVFEPPAD